jgi:hypothetical protein
MYTISNNNMVTISTINTISRAVVENGIIF